MNDRLKILAVDDDRVMLVMLEEQLIQKGYNALVARDGESALRLLDQHRHDICAVLLDRNMPGMDGMEVVRRIKADAGLRHIPIIMQTGMDTPQQVREGIDAGVFYYLTKPVVESVLDSVLGAAVREVLQRRSLRREISSQQQAYTLIDTCRLRGRTLADVESLAIFLANCFPDPERVGIGLLELLTNALEHGNLGIGYAEKTQLVAQGNWRSEVIRRTDLPDYAGKFIDVVLQIKTDGVYVQITDAGAGFDWKSYLTIDPSRATDNHGRGIAQANAQCFDAMRYNMQGNQVLAVAFTNPEQAKTLEW
jgi:two-component system cell cycle response regulator